MEEGRIIEKIPDFYILSDISLKIPLWTIAFRWFYVGHKGHFCNYKVALYKTRPNEMADNKSREFFPYPPSSIGALISIGLDEVIPADILISKSIGVLCRPEKGVKEPQKASNEIAE